MKRIISLILAIVMVFTCVSISASADNAVKVVYISQGKTDFEVTGLNIGDTYVPNRMPSSVPADKNFVGWKDVTGKFIDEQGISLDANDIALYAVYSDKNFTDKNAVILRDKTNNDMIYLPYTFGGKYYSSIRYELNGGFGPKEYVLEGEDAPYTRFVSGQYNGRGATLFYDENGAALTGRWNTTYEITVQYRVKNIVSYIQMQPIFGVKKENAQNINSDGIKGNILKIASTDELTGRWNYDISGGGNEYWFGTSSADATQFNILESGFNDWRTVTYTINTGEENSDYLTAFGIYVNVGGGYNANVLEIKDITVTDKYSASVEYVVDGKTFGVAENIEGGTYYAIDRAPENTSTHYFAGWYLDEQLTNQARSGFIANGKTTLYAKMQEYKDTFSVSSSAETGEGWEAYKHSLRENNWWCYRILVGAYGVYGGKYGDLLSEGQAHRHFGAEADGNTAVADESGLKHEKRDRNNRIWYGYDKSDYILRDENGEAFIVEPDTTYKVELTYTFDNSQNTGGYADYYLGAGLNTNALLYSGEMKLYDVDGETVPVNTFGEYGHTDGHDVVFHTEGDKVRLTPTTTDKKVALYITTPSLETFKANNLLQVLSISDVLSDKCTVVWKKVEVSKVNTVVCGGVSMLKNFNPKNAQALRFYFGYDTTDGSDVFVAGRQYKVVSRGILVAKGLDDSYDLKREGADSKYVYDLNTTELYKCWNIKSYDDTTEQLFYSCYISDIAPANGKFNDVDRFYARGYVVYEQNGKTYTLYSDPASYTVKEVAALAGYHNEGSFALTTDKNRKLVWNVEFETETHTDQLAKKLNTSAQTMSPDGVTLFCANDSDHYFIDSGSLVLRMTKDSTNNTFTTAPSLTTVDRMSFKHGYLEMRAKLPYMYGMWFSFWMQPDKKLLPEDFRYYGEIDVIETWWQSRSTSFSLHKWYNGYQGCTSHNAGEVDVSTHEGNYRYYFENSENLKNEYHIYGFEWTDLYIKLYIDGECYYTVYIDDAHDYDTSVPGMECFHDFYYLSWNNFMHPSYADKLNFENGYADYAIDYVRIYQNENEEIKIY